MLSFFFDPSLSLPGALKCSDAVLESDAPNARLGREPTRPDFTDSIGRDSHFAAFFTYMGSFWSTSVNRYTIRTYVDDPGEIFECYCSAAVSLRGLLSLSQKDGEPEGHDDLNRHI